MKHAYRLFLALALGLAATAASAVAQNYNHTSRAYVPAVEALGMGDAAVAFPMRQTAFFYNPAHLAHSASDGSRITFIGVRAGMGNLSNLFDQVDFYNDELKPAIDEGFDNIDDTERIADIYARADELSRNRTVGNADVLLPSATFRVGPVSAGMGLFARTRARYRTLDSGQHLDMDGLGDAIAVASAAIQPPLTGLSVGTTAKFTYRMLTMKNVALEGIDNLRLYNGTALTLDFGALYELGMLPIPGDVTLGLAIYDIALSDFDYSFSRDLQDLGNENDEVLREKELARVGELYALQPNFRVGASYMVPAFFGALQNTGVALDYVSWSSYNDDQPFLAHLRMGVQTRVARILALRAGLSQGYTTLGAGLSLGFMNIDYAYYGVEDGRLPGSLPLWTHSLQISFGIL